MLISDDLPVDEAQRDEMLETFQARHHGGDGRAVGRRPGDETSPSTRRRTSRDLRSIEEPE